MQKKVGNENLFILISKNSRFKIEEIIALFPEGYLSLLKFYFKELNAQMTSSSKNLDLIRMKTHERIRELILLRLKITNKEKKLIKRSYFNLLLPHHSKIASKLLYNTVDQMWFYSR